MRRCKYIYCGEPLMDGADSCPVCHFPSHAEVADIGYAKKVVPALPVPAMIDMHQIIPAGKGSLTQQLEMMEALNIERALLQSVPTKVESILSNRALLEIRDSHPEKFIISHFMDPRHPQALKRLKQYRERGVRIIKLLPCLGYQPDAGRWRRFFRTMEREGLIAMVHTGFITARHKSEERKAGVFLNSRFGRPIYFDELARRFPGIQFILCHMGGMLWCREAVEMVNQHENVWGDISGSGIAALRQITGEALPVKWEKIFWGNDSKPSAYSYNLNLLNHVLNQAGMSGLSPDLIYNNGKRFIDSYLS